MDPPVKLTRGQVLEGIPATSWNAFVDAWHRSFQIRPPKTRLNTHGSMGSTQLVMRAIATEDLDALSPIVMLDGAYVKPDPADTPAQASLKVKGPRPTVNVKAHDGEEPYQFGVCLKALAQNDVGTVIVEGVCWAEVDIKDAAHTHAKAKAGEIAFLESNGGNGARIIYKPDETGRQWCLIALGQLTDTMSVIKGYAVEDTPPDQAIKIDRLELLWDKLPEGKVADCSGSVECEFELRNIFEKQYVAGEIIVGFQTIDRTPSQPETGGLSIADARDYATEDAVDDWGDETAVGYATGGDAVWWGFGIGTTEPRLFRTTTTIGPAVWSESLESLDLGSGQARMFTSAGGGYLTLLGDAQIIHNFVQTAIEPNRNVHATLMHGLWVIDAEDCPPEQ